MDTPPTETPQERHLRQLTEMAEVVMEMARLAHREAQARVAAAEAGEPVPQGAFGPDLGLTVDRLTRSLRLTIALEDRLIAGHRERERKAAEERQARAKAHTEARKAQVRSFVERLIEHDYEAEEAENVLDGLDEYWDDGTPDHRFATLPIPDLVAKVCNDLDIPFDPTDWEGDEDLQEPPEPPDLSSPPTRSAWGEGRERGDACDAGSPAGSSHDPPRVATHDR